MNKKIKKILVVTVAVICLIFGVLGLVLPFLQGILFLAIGFLLLSFAFPQVRFYIEEHTKRYPRLYKVIEKIEGWLQKIIGEV